MRVFDGNQVAVPQRRLTLAGLPSAPRPHERSALTEVPFRLAYSRSTAFGWIPLQQK